MKKIMFSIICLALVFSLLTVEQVDAAALKWMRYGNWQAKVTSTGDMGEGGLGWAESGYYIHPIWASPPFGEAYWASHACFIGTDNWTDESGTLWPVKLTGYGQWDSDELYTLMPVPDEQGREIRKYLRSAPPTITVDGIRIDDPFPFDDSEEVNPDKIPGSAFAMVESWANTDMGLTLHQKVYQWAQGAHDDYLIYDWTWTNTGNTDLDDDIELPNQTLQNVYFLRQERPHEYNMWMSSYGEAPTDSMRLLYSYPQTAIDADHDNFGAPDLGTGFLNFAVSTGLVILHVDRSTSDPSNDPSQPNTSGVANCDFQPFVLPPIQTGQADWFLCYETMQNGWLNYPGWSLPEFEGQWAGKHKSVRFDEHVTSLGLADQTAFMSYPTLAHYWSIGPYTMAPGESFRVVFAYVGGGLGVGKDYEVGKAWLEGTATFPGEDNLPPQFDVIASDDNDRAKDLWVYSTVDTLFRNAYNAVLNYEADFDVPVPPQAPDIEVWSRPNGVDVLWSNSDDSDIAGYRVWRAIGTPYPDFQVDKVIGVHELIFECGAGTDNPTIVNEFRDVNAIRGQPYFYAVTAFNSDGLESGRLLNLTTTPAFLTRTAGSLDQVRVVPNPYNWGARSIQYVGEPNKIKFMDVPGVCTIRIYTESGDLIKTIEHTDGSGDASWGVQLEEHQTTETGQLVVSGVYIAHITTPEGESKNVKFVIVR
jgi:hypothetical protein